MKTYQFVTFAIVGLAIAAVLLYKGHKKPCSCSDHEDAAILPAEGQ